MIQEPLTPQISEQQQQRQSRTEYITEQLKSYPIQINSLSSPVKPRILLIQSSGTNPVVTQLVAIPRKQTKTQTRIIRIPFLPSSEPIAVLMKQSIPTEKGSVKNSNLDTELSKTTNSYYPPADINYRHLTESISSNTYNYNSNLIGNNQRNQNCCQILYLNQSQNENQLNQTKNQELPPQKPLTLASMAGIQLTSADESHTMEMSGAMQPTATVEEINVPVFVDEYLQQSTQTLSPTTKTTLEEAATAATIINNNNYNQYNCVNNDNSNNNHNYNGNGIICLENETFENLDFNIEMIAEDTNDMMTMTIGEKMENNNNNSNFYYCTNSSSNSSTTYNNNNNNTHNNNNNMLAFIAELEPKVEPQFHTSPGMEHDFLSEDITIYSLDQDMAATANILSNEEAVDISNFNNDFSLFTEEPICSSQNDPMFTEGQKFTQELQKSEPIIEPDDEYELYKKQDMQQTYYQEVPAIEEDEFDIKLIHPKEEQKAPETTGAKRKQHQHRSTSSNMQEKRRKLQLNTKFSMNNIPATLSTPDVINLFVDEEPTSSNFGTYDEIMNMLANADSVDVSPLNANADTTCFAALVDSSDETIFFAEEESSPCTPSSSTTNTIPTGFTNISSSPNSPALSTNSAATTITSSALHQQTQRKRRGRPSKAHSDKPDPEQLVQLSEAERKRLEDRAKNNEASRLSRLKNKHKEEAEIEEQDQLLARNIAMKSELEHLEHMTHKLERALHKRIMHRQR